MNVIEEIKKEVTAIIQAVPARCSKSRVDRETGDYNLYIPRPTPEGEPQQYFTSVVGVCAQGYSWFLRDLTNEEWMRLYKECLFRGIIPNGQVRWTKKPEYKHMKGSFNPDNYNWWLAPEIAVSDCF